MFARRMYTFMAGDEILNASILYTEEDVWAEFKESCKAEAEEAGETR